MFRQRTFVLFSLFLAVQVPLFAQQDLNVERARNRRDAEAADAARAKSEYDRTVQRLRNEEAALAQAKSEESSARSSLSTAERQLQNTESNITSLDRKIAELQYEISGLNTQLTSDRSDLQTLVSRRDQLKQRVRHLQQEAAGISRDLERLNADPEANRKEIQRLEARLRRTQDECDREQGILNRVESDIDSKEREIQRKQQSISSSERDIANARTEISNLERQRTRLLSDINFYRNEISRAVTQVRTCERNVDLAESDVNSAYSVYQREQSEAQTAQRYYEEVQANYNRELQAVYRQADLAARRDATQEATARATRDGEQAGQFDGRVGQEHGRADGEQVASLAGYRDARANPQLDTPSYNEGMIKGSDLAIRKASTEDFPLGYNNALQAFLARVPSSEMHYELTGDATFPAGENSSELSSTPMSVGRLRDPEYPIANDPAVREPVVPSPTITVPQFTLGNAPCSGLILPEFEPMCRTRYRDTYASSFRDSYVSNFNSAYRTSYSTTYRDLYTQSRNSQYPTSRASGLRQGALDQGTLLGFANRLPTARQEARAEGDNTLKARSQVSHLVFVRSVSLSDRDGDGVFSPGELLDINVVIDNIGFKPTPDGKLKFKITGKAGIASVLHELRTLPSIPADTRLTLVGATTIKGASVYSGDKIQIKGELQNANGQAVHSFVLDQQLRYALEMSDITLEKDPALGEEVAATIKFVNRSQIPTSAKQVTMAVVPKIADISTTATIEIPELAPGAEFVADAKVKPGTWVGENTFVNFQATLVNLGEPLEQLVQPFRKFIHVNRTASLLLFDRNNSPIESGRLVVNAGSTIAINASMRYHSNRALPGPFVIRAANKSHPVISHPSNTTISVNYGSWSPSRPMPTVMIQYVIPESLRGQEAWVMLQLSEGSTTLHTPMIYLDVK